jgi:hypothetical protein
LAFYWSATKWQELPLAGTTQCQHQSAPLVISVCTAAAVTAARQGVSDLNLIAVEDMQQKCSFIRKPA